MHVRRLSLLAASLLGVASSFALGAMHTRQLAAADRATYDARLDGLRAELQRALAREASLARAVPTAGSSARDAEAAPTDGGATGRDRLIADIKEQLRSEMGLVPVSLIRDRRSSFVELQTTDSRGERGYGTAGYLGRGYFVTVKHAVIALAGDDRRVESIRVLYRGTEVPARVIDSGTARSEVDRGDWAILKTRNLDLPALSVDTSFSFDFAEPIFRLGNDYSKGIVVSTGYIGQKTDGGLVTSLTDGHPGVSGGGVLDQRGFLVGIPIGRMQGDYRFSFILPLRSEMLRKIPPQAQPATP